MEREEVLREMICVGHDAGSPGHCVLFANRRWLPLDTAYHLRLQAERDKGLRVGQVACLEAKGVRGLLAVFTRA